jgi:hypothetical protein
MYAYKPPRGRFQMIMVDIDWVMLASGARAYSPSSPIFGVVEDPRMTYMFDQVPFKRAYYRAYHEQVNGPLRTNAFYPVLEATHRMLQTNGFPSIGDPAPVKDWINQRRSFLAGQLGNLGSTPFTAIVTGTSALKAHNLLVLSGSAPVQVTRIVINDVDYDVTWTDVTSWTVRLPLNPGTSSITIKAFDYNGKQYGSTRTINASYSGTVPPPGTGLVLNEIHYNPALPETSFVEIHNTTTNFSFNLLGYRFSGLDLTFTRPAIVEPGKFLIVAKNAQAFGTAFGYGIPVAAEFSGELSNGGERLRLIKTGLTPATDVVVDQVTYDDDLPWPLAADGTGPSLQLVDPRQDNRRVANWKAAAPTPGTTNSVVATLTAFDSIWINEVQPHNTIGPVDSAGNRDPWIELFNGGTSVIQLKNYFLTDTYANLTAWKFPDSATLSPGQFLVVWLDGQPAQSTATEYHASFRMNVSTGSVALVTTVNGSPAVMDYYNYRGVGAGRSVGSFPDGQPDDRQVFYLVTPGASNDGSAPPVRINEWLTSNTRILRDSADGHFEDWIELYNYGNQAVDLSGYYLADNLANSNEWRLPEGAILPAQGFLLIWADEETGQNGVGGDLHASFKLSSSGEQIGLFTPGGLVVDSVVFGVQSSDVSQGRYPDGAVGPDYYFMPEPTPRAKNKIPGGGTPPQPRVTQVSVTATGFHLTWETVAGRRYQVQTSETLTPAIWQNLGNAITSTGTSLSLDDDRTGRTQRFYRVVVE